MFCPHNAILIVSRIAPTDDSREVCLCLVSGLTPTVHIVAAVVLLRIDFRAIATCSPRAIHGEEAGLGAKAVPEDDRGMPLTITERVGQAALDVGITLAGSREHGGVGVILRQSAQRLPIVVIVVDERASVDRAESEEAVAVEGVDSLAFDEGGTIEEVGEVIGLRGRTGVEGVDHLRERGADAPTEVLGTQRCCGDV